MFVKRFGEAGDRAVLLLHGGGVGGWMWDPVRVHLDAGLRLRLVVPDLPGHDHSADEDYVSHDETLAGLESLIESESGPVAVVGFSLGAQLAILLAARRPDLVDRVVIVSAQARPTPAPGLTLALLGATAGLAKQEWFAKLQAKELFVPDELLADYVRTSATVSRRTLLAAVGDNIRFEIPPEWSSFPGRALVLAGSQERAVMKESARMLHDALPGSALELVEGSGHGIPLQQPAWFATRLRAHLSEP